MFKWTN